MSILPCLGAALEYAARGLVVLPVKLDKSPHTPHGVKDASRDPETIRAWWAQWPDSGVGIPCGSINGIVVLDVDPRHGGGASLAELLREHGPLPDGPRSRTGGGGNHFIMGHPGGVVRTRHAFRPGLDFQSDGTYIVAPPSLHASGMAYVWEAELNGGKPPMVPAWLLKITQRARGTQGTPGPDAGFLGPDGRVLRGVRQEFLWRVGASLRAQGFDAKAIRATLVAQATSLLPPPEPGDRPYVSVIDEIVGRLKGRPTVQPPPVPVCEGEYSPPDGAAELWAPVDAKGRPCPPDEAADERPNKVGFVLGIIEDVRVLTVPGDVRDRIYAYGPATGVFRPDGAARIRAWVERQHRLHGGRSASNLFVTEVLAAVARRTHCSPDAFDHPGLININNCVLDLETRERRDHTPEVPFLYVLPVSYDPSAPREKFDAFLTMIVPGEATRAFLGEWFGYTFFRGNDLKHAAVLYGATDTGRTTLLRIVEGVLGPDACSAVSLYELARHKYALGALKGKLANICDDMSAETVPDLSIFKRITGSSPVQIEEKYKDPYAGVLGVKLTFTCNELPELQRADDAVWNRWFAIEFKVQIDKKDQVAGLWSRIIEAEGSGVLNWMLEGYDRLRERGRFADVPTIEATKKRWVRASDSFRAWAVEEGHLVADPKGWTAKKAIMDVYEAWCEEEAVPAVRYEIVCRTVTRLYPVVSSKKGPVPGWKGIALRDPGTGSAGSVGTRQNPLDGWIPEEGGEGSEGLDSSVRGVGTVVRERGETQGTHSTLATPAPETMVLANALTLPPPGRTPSDALQQAVYEHLQSVGAPDFDPGAELGRVHGLSPHDAEVGFAGLSGLGYLVHLPNGRCRLK